MRTPTALRILPALAATALLGACTASNDSLSEAARDKEGVLRVEVQEHGGDDHIPFSTVAKSVTIRMEAAASVDEVMAVFDAYDDTIDGRQVDNIEVVLDGGKDATLSAGEGIHMTREVVTDLVKAQHDRNVREYVRAVNPDDPGLTYNEVSLTIAAGGFGDLVTAADSYEGVASPKSVGVRSGSFILVRDEEEEGPRPTAARESFTQRIDREFALKGALVSGQGPLELTVAPSDVEAVRRVVARGLDRRIGRVLVKPAR